MGKLIMVGHGVSAKLAVLGVDMDRPLGPWHIMQPGRHAIPQVGDEGKVIGSTLCGRWAVTNGYAADFAPQGQDLCPACSERL